jgi:UDP-N-acetylglucosamine 4,6-dehydratase
VKSLLITGGTGSFGRAFAKRILKLRYGSPFRLVIYSRGEHAQEDMARELNDDRLRFFIGDVRDKDRLEMAMRTVDTVVHTAALKIVPTAEYNPTECVATNVTGTENVVKAALRIGVRRSILLSTDKAVSPINLYGSTKLAAEKIFVASNNLAAGSAAFSVVRYGNVLGSRGSVVPFFKQCLAQGKPLPITDPEMTRFSITMDQAINLVLETLHLMEGGEIAIPKIPSMKIMDLAEAMDPVGKREIVGIRPGEKIHECLLTADEARLTTNERNCFVIHNRKIAPSAGPKVDEGFSYSSNTNTEWLTPEQIRRMI